MPKKPKDENLPHADEMEQALLGSVLIANRTDQGQILDHLVETDFFNPIHRALHHAICQMREEQKPVNVLTFTQELRDRGELEAAGGAPYITGLFTVVPVASNALYYVGIVKDKAMLRALIERCEKTIAYARREDEYFTTEQVLNHAKERFSAIERWNADPPKTFAEYSHEKWERMQAGEPDLDVIKTGLIDLDLQSPLRKGDLPIIKAARKVGKSILALSILENICIEGKGTGLLFSLEDRIPKVIDRIFAGVSRIPMNLDHTQKLDAEQCKEGSAAITKMIESQIIIYDDVYDLLPILARARKAATEHPDLTLIVVDYAQLIRVKVKKNESREREVATISRAFRLLAMELAVPIVLISQVNADGESRESRALEQDCTASWALFHEEEEHAGKRIFKVEFQRNGASGVVFPVTFQGNIARVENFTETCP